MFISSSFFIFFFFFFNDTATTEIYTLSLHDALPIWLMCDLDVHRTGSLGRDCLGKIHRESDSREDRKSTRLNSSHGSISYAVFCLKKKKKKRDSSREVNTHRKPKPIDDIAENCSQDV